MSDFLCPYCSNISFNESHNSIKKVVCNTNSKNINKDFHKIQVLGLNVYGLESKLRLGILDEYAKAYQIICLSERKTDSPDLSNTSLFDYTCFIKNKKVHKHKFGGIHGLCMLVNKNVSKYAKLLDEYSSDNVALL